MGIAHNFVSWSAGIDKIREEDGILGAREPAGCHLAGALLDGDPLVVLVESLRGWEDER